MTFQIGTKPWHRAQDHLFVLKSIIALDNLYGLSILLQLYDISKFFDQEHLRDAKDVLYQRGTRGKLYRLLYEINKDTKVKTALGVTEKEDTGEAIGQGTNEGAMIFTVNKHFETRFNEITNLPPLALLYCYIYKGSKMANPFLAKSNSS